MEAPTTIRVGLRFDPGDRQLLQFLADRADHEVALRDQGDIFHKVADAAQRGEPLVVHAETIEEVGLLAGGFTLFGVKAPAIEDLQSRRF